MLDIYLMKQVYAAEYVCVFISLKKKFLIKNGTNRPTNYSSMAGWRGDLLKLCHPSTGYLYQNQLYNNYIGTRWNENNNNNNSRFLTCGDSMRAFFVLNNVCCRIRRTLSATAATIQPCESVPVLPFRRCWLSSSRRSVQTLRPPVPFPSPCRLPSVIWVVRP